MASERLCIDAQFEWEAVYGGRLDTDQITEACRRLQMAQLEAEAKAFPTGFNPGARFMALAKEETSAHFHVRYHAQERQ